jgi:Zn-dependent peptidase ImmA (M78 family)
MLDILHPKTTRRSMAKAAAERLTSDISTPPVPVLEIAEENGVDVVFVDFGKHADTVSGLCDFDEAKILVNKDDHSNRQSFTIAHELGHWVLHKDLFEADPDSYALLPRFHKPDRANTMEQEANHFAANLLVPAKLLLPVKTAPVSSLANVFGVSKTMMEFRLKNV